MDWTRSLAYVRTSSLRPQIRTALELIHSDGLLTAQRVGKGGNSLARLCPMCNSVEDSSQHRFWKCSYWQHQRQQWGIDDSVLDPVTRALGLLPLDSLISDELLRKVQAWMAKVILESSEAHWRPRKSAQSETQNRVLPRSREEEAGHASVSLSGRILDLRTDDGDGYYRSAVPPPLPLPLSTEGRQDKRIEQASLVAGPRRHNKRSVEPPPHIVRTKRKVTGGQAMVTAIWRCDHCGAEMSGHNFRRFVELHMLCATTKAATCPKRVLTKAERMQVTYASGRSLEGCSLGKRRRLIAAAVT